MIRSGMGNLVGEGLWEYSTKWEDQMGKDLRRLGAGIGVLLEIDKSGGETLARQKKHLGIPWPQE